MSIESAEPYGASTMTTPGWTFMSCHRGGLDFTGLIEQAGWPTAPTWDTASYDRFLERPAEGQRWRFRVTANPTRSVPRGEGRGRVAPHRTAAHQSHGSR